MRFSAPRSDSPIRRPTRRKSTYGVPSDSEDEEFSSEETVASSSTDSFVYESESEIPEPPPRTKRLGRSVSQQHNMEDMISSIRLRVTHRDAYEEWEQQTRKDAFVSARDEQAAVNSIRRQSLATSQTLNSSTRSSQRQKQIDEVQNMLARFKIAKDQEETKFKQAWKERDRQIWEKIEHVIKAEEEKVKAKLEAERRKREEEERKKKEAEERARQEEERRRQAAEKKRQEEEEQRKQWAQEEEEKKRLQELEKQRAEQEQAEAEERKALGMTTALEDWKRGRDYLNRLKTGPMRMVKGRKETKSVWSAARRQITPKIGQITNDAQAIARITQQLIDILKPTPPHPLPIYFALLSSLAKSILLQAETEVTAEKRSAIPLAQVTANLLQALQHFDDIFWAKFCQRAGGWPVPCAVPGKDFDDKPFNEAGRRKALGYREGETLSDYGTRVTGIMRVYFHIMSAPVSQPLDPRYRMPRYWTYFARMLSDPQLLQSFVGAEILFAALDVNGAVAMEIWGAQWIKLLGILYEGCTTGLFGQEGRLIGGTAPEGVASRVRVQVDIERLMSAV